jgi:uncharacterized protein (DUF3084 family)
LGLTRKYACQFTFISMRYVPISQMDHIEWEEIMKDEPTKKQKVRSRAEELEIEIGAQTMVAGPTCSGGCSRSMASRALAGADWRSTPSSNRPRRWTYSTASGVQPTAGPELRPWPADLRRAAQQNLGRHAVVRVAPEPTSCSSPLKRRKLVFQDEGRRACQVQAPLPLLHRGFQLVG